MNIKKHSRIFELLLFCILFLFFVLPPCFSFINQSQSIFTEWNFPVTQMILFVIAIFIYLYCKYLRTNFQWNKFDILLKLLFPFVYTVTLLFSLSLFFKYFSIIFQNHGESAGIQITKPESALQWIFCLLNLGFSAFYEEVIFRFYLTDGFLHLINKDSKIIRIAVEAVTALLFAFGHLYMGFLSFLNALFAHIILRICYKRSESIYGVFAAHYIYNIISLILL